ncbi:hypothetical protein ILUMI_07766 [Ignelater luminosus]|uniref:DDE Tnp4 domain-containing protein n=1 Tax=Ignelater luminosus TaxID=2038154 RepID=A0A8K0GHP8_IGNLU|nr:hypothetical protein ILUMI_07766 [Ignelater luminosus]
MIHVCSNDLIYFKLLNLIQDNNLHLGDAAYKFTRTMMVPYKAHERAFALLKGRLRRLQLLETLRLDLIPLTIICARMCHSICLQNGDALQGDVNINVEIEEEEAF